MPGVANLQQREGCCVLGVLDDGMGVYHSQAQSGADAEQRRWIGELETQANGPKSGGDQVLQELNLEKKRRSVLQEGLEKANTSLLALGSKSAQVSGIIEPDPEFFVVLGDHLIRNCRNLVMGSPGGFGAVGMWRTETNARVADYAPSRLRS